MGADCKKSQSIESSESKTALEEELGYLQLMNRALVTMLRESPSWDEDRFQKLVYDIDMEDGVQDGKVTPKAK